MANERARKLGYKYITDDKYLVNPFSPTEGISYEGDGSPVSYANSGIMAQAPYIYPPINQGGGDGGGGGFTGPTGPGSYDSAFDPETQNKQFNEDIGVGTVAEEDDEKGTSLGIVDALRAMGAFTFGGPLNAGYSLKRSVDRNKQKEMDKMNAEIEAQYGPNDPGLRGNDGTPGFGITAKGYHTNQFDGGDPGQGGGTTSGFDTGGGKEMMADGGRAGYFFGGRVNYKAGGRTDAESQYGADSAGSYDSSQNQSGREQSYGGNNNTPTINKFAGSNVIESPFGELGGNTDTKIGYRGGVDLAKLGLTMGVDGTLTNRNFLTNDDIENKGTFYTGTDNDIFNTATNYDNSGIGNTFLNSNTPFGDFGVTLDNNGKVVQGDYGNNYKGVDVNATTNFDDLNNISLSKFSGDPTKNGFSYGIGANINPYDLSNSNAYLQARYAFGQGKKDGGRIGFKNGGLASIL
jgi:hypothetical protein